eukprot:2490248-Rhodomonas_salina.3
MRRHIAPSDRSEPDVTSSVRRHIALSAVSVPDVAFSARTQIWNTCTESQPLQSRIFPWSKHSLRQYRTSHGTRVSI